ncbi:ornithine carbamoyltransferase [Methanococcus vannielii SB]|uniref:Ornithine carbamoyltransferase n=1 Tax=Methanococcus vannielii (strain ATCC 35089 / DSM 1224 / JCM 13029 / OCM 148 / SB) TaxID=406327 RepID=OTC_METVS|nr:ornithine carbamoyltransferase [Methanococcus vannielii]A6UNM1.1 RecName: Full=Ornithine carbamoyltransferase; Short=OTCase [Methanococcus vannielii SB]ABR54093.1 ornithine carbamoyltransferase [Methanococcus vannielii SB]
MDMLTLWNLEREDMEKILEDSIYFKKNRYGHDILKNKNIALIFESPSTRTRMSFDLAVNELGGHSMVMNENEIHLGKKESIKDTAKVMSRFVDVIVARVKSHKTLEDLAFYGTVPVINALSDLSHPCQVLADLLTIKENGKDFKNLKLAYFGDGNNVSNSLMIAGAILGMNIFIATPRSYEPNGIFVKKALEIIAKYGEGSLTLTDDPIEASKNADVLYTDVWISMSDKNKDLEDVKRIFPKFQINSKLLSNAKKDAMVLHCLPANRGMEITDEVIDSKQSKVFDQAENRLHVQKAVLKYVLKDK